MASTLHLDTDYRELYVWPLTPDEVTQSAEIFRRGGALYVRQFRPPEAAESEGVALLAIYHGGVDQRLQMLKARAEIVELCGRLLAWSKHKGPTEDRYDYCHP